MQSAAKMGCSKIVVLIRTGGRKSAGHYKSHYSGASAMTDAAAKLLRGLVGAWRFEFQTSCAQASRATF
jgi:hypothetical protein